MPALPPFDVLNTLTLVLLFTPPSSPVPCPSSLRVGSRGGSMMHLGVFLPCRWKFWTPTTSRCTGFTGSR